MKSKRAVFRTACALLMLFVSAVSFAQNASSGASPSGASAPATNQDTGTAAVHTPADSVDPALYAVGALGASNLYTTYFLLGTLADGYATAAYTASFATELAHDVIGLNESSVDVLRRLLADDGLVGDDRQLVNDMITAHGLLINQAWGLISYIDDEKNTKDWFDYRRQAWELIKRLLGIR